MADALAVTVVISVLTLVCAGIAAGSRGKQGDRMGRKAASLSTVSRFYL